MRKVAFNLYLFFLASWFLHLTARIPALGLLRLDLLLVLIITALIVVTRQEMPPRPKNNIRRLIFILTTYAVVTLPFVEWPGTVLRVGLPDFVKAFVFYYFSTELVQTPRQLRLLLTVFIAGQSFRVIEPLYLHLTTGYWGSMATMGEGESMEWFNRLAGAPSDIINPNGLAFVILTVIPFFHYLGPMTKLGGLLYIAFLPSAVYALLLTASRSGLLGLVITGFLIWWKSRRKVLLATFIVIGACVATASLSDDLGDRYRSIFSSNTKNARTAEGRFSGMEGDFRVALRRPLFGHGLGASVEANAHFNTRAERSHNLYTEVAIELGFIGLAIFIAFLYNVVRTVRVTLSAFRGSGVKDGLVYRLSLAVYAYAGMNILFSFASYGLSSYEWYLLAGLSELIHRFNSAEETAPAPSPAPSAREFSPPRPWQGPRRPLNAPAHQRSIDRR